MSLPAIRAALRIARRDARRAKGRSALVLAMIGLPMLGLAFADVTARTAQLAPADEAARTIGAADLTAWQFSTGHVVQNGTHSVRADGPPPSPDEVPTTAEVAALLPAGSRVVERHVTHDVRIGVTGAVVPGELRVADLADPMHRGIVDLRDGTFPTAPGETALTRRAATTLRAGVGDTVQLGFPAKPFKVTGIVRDPGDLSARAAYVLPGATVNRGASLLLPEHRYAVDLPADVRDTDVLATLNEHGYLVEPRTWFFDPPDDPFANDSAEAWGVLVVVVGLAMLEVMLLAGAAFAVGARRSQRDLALVAATGGDRKDVRRVVLGGGVVLGAFAGAVAIAGAILVMVFGRGLLERLAGQEFGPLDLRPLELGGIVALAVGTALLAAVLPARQAARQQVVAALTGRRGQTNVRLRVPLLGLVAVAAGTGLAWWAARDSKLTVVLAGAVLAELGFVSCAPAAVALVGRVANRLPLSLRLAARDAARHRARSGPAVAAVVAAVAGSVAISTYTASDEAGQRRSYQPRAPYGVVQVLHKGGSFGPKEEAELKAALPVKDRVDLAVVGEFCVGRDECNDWLVERPDGKRTEGNGPNIAVSTPGYVELLTGHADRGVADALRRGEVVVLDDRYVTNGRVTLLRQRGGPGRPVQGEERTTYPAYVVHVTTPLPSMPFAVMSAETARTAGLPYVPILSMYTTTRLPTEREEAQAAAIVDGTGLPIGIYVERGFRPHNGIAMLVLLVVAAVVTVGATAIATGLAAADSRPDLATLAAVGAPPRVRRRLAMAQAMTVAALGSALGILAGLVPALSIVGARAAVPLALPVRNLAITAVAVPLVAALLVGACTRSRLPMARRLA